MVVVFQEAGGRSGYGGGGFQEAGSRSGFGGGGFQEEGGGGQEGTVVGVPGGRQWAWGLWVTLIVLGCFQVSDSVGGRWLRSG